jgi:N-acetylneuraminic acid mutarotase
LNTAFCRVRKTDRIVKRKSATLSAFFSPRVLVVVLLCAAVCSIATQTLPAFRAGGEPAKMSQRTLTFVERVAYQRIIEDVYWRHRIWPKDRPDPKPSLDAVMSQEQLEKKVSDYLRKSQALEDYWQHPITAQQLQTEMDRMAKHTRQPEVLHELFNALGNDPFVIAECLARAALAEHLITNWYVHDVRIHGKLKQRAKAELKTHPTVEQMKHLNGKYSETEVVRSDSLESRRNPGHEHALKLNPSDWDETVQKLASAFGVRRRVAAFESAERSTHSKNGIVGIYESIPTGRFSALQEDETRYYATAIVGKTENDLKLITVSWPKEPLQSWIANAESQISTAMTPPISNYSLPKISDGGSGCIDDTWTATVYSPVGRFYHTAVWTGTEMIIWGGYAGGPASASGGRYNAATDTWMPTSTVNVPPARTSPTSIWTGSEMIVWGGRDQNLTDLNTGGRYNPGTDTWTTTSTINAPSARVGHTAVWTGKEMIIWGGYHTGNLNTGGKYNPSTDTWTITSTVNAPSARNFHTAVWTGGEMIIWGAAGSNTGGRYNPSTDTWTATSTSNAPTARFGHTAVWTGIQMIVWGGSDGTNFLNTGGKYNPNSDSWTATSTINAPDGREIHTAVWTDSEMIVWGGDYLDGSDVVPLNTGGRYNPSTDAWLPTDSTNAPVARTSHTAAWTGAEMVVWGGLSEQLEALNSGGRYSPAPDSWTPTAATLSQRSSHTAVWSGTEMIVWGGWGPDLLDTGSRYNPATDSWTATASANAPYGRDYHSAVWTGGEMIVWGGQTDSGPTNTGGLYNPGTNSWTPSSTNNAPAARYWHTSVWSGTEMIVWGGSDGFNDLNTGGKYTPSTNSWTPTSSGDAPSGREFHTSVWTGSEMIIWGGSSSNFPFYFNTGGKYNPNTNSWTPTSIMNAPNARSEHKAVWAGNEMIVWGGLDVSSLFDTGGRYDPSTNSWKPTSMVNAPSARFHHTAVWTNSEMIIWGGQDSNLEDVNTGSRYKPGSDTWTATSTTNVPAARELHTAVWTGSEMIIWAGLVFAAGELNSGGRYCAQSGPTPTPNPTPRATPTPRISPTPRSRPTPPPHLTPPPPPATTTPTAAPRPTPPPHITPVPPPPSPRPTPWLRP